MSIYLIVLNDPDPGTWEAVKAKWGDDHRFLTDRIAFVAPEKTVLTREIADTLGMNKEGGIRGIIVEMENFSGFNSADAVEWVRKFR